MTFPGHTWRTSSYSANGGECVEVAVTSGAVAVRDSKDRNGGHFTMSPDRWKAFLNAVQADAFR